MRRKLKIEDLWLYESEVTYAYPGSNSRAVVTLFITTKKRSASRALEKTERFLKRKASEYPQPIIKSVKERGTLDA